MKITLEIPNNIMRIATEIEELREIKEYDSAVWASKAESHEQHNHNQMVILEISDRFQKKVDLIYKREKIRKVEQRKAVSDARKVIALTKRYNGKIEEDSFDNMKMDKSKMPKKKLKKLEEEAAAGLSALFG